MIGITFGAANAQHSRKFSSRADSFFGSLGFDGMDLLTPS
jgi:hypothetical protein